MKGNHKHGMSHTISQWSDITNIPSGTIWSRLNSGWSIEKSLTTKAIVGSNQYRIN